MRNYIRDGSVIGSKVAVHSMIVGDVAQVNDQMADICHHSIGILKQLFNIYKYPLQLFDNISLKKTITMPVNAGRILNECTTYISIRDVHPSLESNPVFMRGIKVVFGSQVPDLFRSQVFHTVKLCVKRYLNRLTASAYTC